MKTTFLLFIILLLGNIITRSNSPPMEVFDAKFLKTESSFINNSFFHNQVMIDPLCITNREVISNLSVKTELLLKENNSPFFINSIFKKDGVVSSSRLSIDFLDGKAYHLENQKNPIFTHLTVFRRFGLIPVNQDCVL